MIDTVIFDIGKVLGTCYLSLEFHTTDCHSCHLDPISYKAVIFTSPCCFTNLQNFMEFFLPLADGLDASMVKAEDQQILSLLDTQTKAYATGEKDLDTAISDLKASIHDTYSYLKTE